MTETKMEVIKLMPKEYTKAEADAFKHGFFLGAKSEREELIQEEPVWIKELQDKLDSLSKEDFDKIWAKYDKYDKVEEPVTSVWHEPSEIPEEKKWILLAHKEGWYHVGRLYEGQCKNLVISDGVSTFELNMFNKWVYVDDILKF